MTKALSQTVAELRNDLAQIETEHDEVTDTQVREAISEVLMRGFVQREPDYQIPATFFMFSAAGNEAVRSALEGFFARLEHAYHANLDYVTKQALLQPLAGFIGHYCEPPSSGKCPKSTVRREFTHYTRAWYSCKLGLPDNLIDDVTFEIWEDQVQIGALHIEWMDLGSTVAPRLVAFDDSWEALAAMPDVVAALGECDDENISPAAFCELLTELGFNDVTPLESPSGD